MSAATAKPILAKKIEELLEGQPDLFLVSLKIDAKNNIKVFLDGDKGITIGQCTSVNRQLYPFVEESGLFPNDDFSLEISSAGVDEPLLLPRQFVKNIGRSLDLVMADGAKHEGKLLTATDTAITLEIVTGKGKKAVTTIEEFVLEHIKTAIVQIKF